MEVIVYDVNDNIVNPEEKEITIQAYYDYFDVISTTDKSA